MKKSMRIASQSICSYSLFKKILTTLVLAFIIPAAAISSGIYKWEDENGKTHYGSQRPENTQAEKMKLHVPEPASKPEPQEEAEGEGDQKKEAKLKDGGDQKKASKERTSYCANERKRLQTIQQNEEIHEKDDSGEVKALSAKARNQRLSKIRANIAKYCK